MPSATPPPLPPDTGFEYRSRTSALDQEVTLRLEAGHLVIVHRSGARELLPLASLTRVCLRFFPTRFQANRYECLLCWNNGRRLKVCSQFFAGMADFHDQAPEYRRWVLELHRLVPEANPACSFHSGLSVLRYSVNALFMIGVFGLLALVMIAFATSIPAIAIIKLVLIACYLPILILWFRRNVPGRYDPTAIPDQVLPTV